MSRHDKPARFRPNARRPALEPLEDRLLLSVPPVVVSSRSALVGPTALVTAAADGTGSNQGGAAVVSDSGGDSTPGDAAYVTTGQRESQDTYTTQAARGSAATTAEYYPPGTADAAYAYREAAPQASAPTLTAIPGTGTPGAVAAAQPPRAESGTSLIAPQGVHAGPARESVPLRPDPGPRQVQGRPSADAVARKALTEEAQALPEVAAGPVKAEATPSPVTEVEMPDLFPLALPLPGGLLPVDLAGWERGVADFFRHLDALGGEGAAEPPWLRLAPWCVALGALTAAMTIVRRQLSKAAPPSVAETAGRGLAWRWPSGPGGNTPPEQP